MGFPLLLFVVYLSRVPLDLPRPLGRLAVPRLPHAAVLGVPGETRGVAVEVGERGASKGALSEASNDRQGGGVAEILKASASRGVFPPHSLFFR